MKLINAVLCFTLAFSLCFLCGCGLIGPQQYVCEEDLVASAQIIQITDVIYEENDHEYTVLKEIEDVPHFIERINSLKHRVHWGDPRVFETGYVVIRIEYVNGDYDWIYRDTQLFVRSDRGSQGYFLFDKDQFDELIADYLQ